MGAAKDETVESPTPDQTDISAMLQESKAKGAQRRKRITGTCLLGGCLGLLATCLIRIVKAYTLERTSNAAQAVELSSLVAIYISVVFLFLSALPTDVRAIKLINWAAVMGLFLVGSMYWYIAWTCCGLILPESFGVAQRFLFYGMSTVIWTHVFLFCKAARLPPRERLDTLWRTFSSFLIFSALFAGTYRVLLVLVDLQYGYVSADDPRMETIAFIRSGCYVTCMAVIGSVCGWPGFRMRAQAWLSSRGETRSLAAAVATAIGGHSVEETEQKAGKLLRYVTLDKISKEELAENKPNPLLYERSMPGKFGDVDAFISHSWSDPSDSKWDGIQTWRNEFKLEHGREPRVWFDKCCIDQLNIDDSLMCLPVHLAACKKILMLVGQSYLSRLWCIMEIFVLIAAVNDTTRIQCIPVQKSKVDSEDPEFIEYLKAKAEKGVVDSFSSFTVGACQCYSSQTRDKLLTIIEAGCGTLDSFDTVVRNIQVPFFATSGNIAENSAIKENVSTAASKDIVEPDAIHAHLAAEAA